MQTWDTFKNMVGFCCNNEICSLCNQHEMILHKGSKKNAVVTQFKPLYFGNETFV